MAVQGYDYADIGGGINAGSAPAAIQSREMSALRNFYPYQTRLRRRGGLRRITTGGAWDQNITGMFPYSTSNGDWFLIVAGPTKFGRLNINSIADLSLAAGISIPSNLYPWVVFQYKDYIYAMKKDGGGLYRLTSTVAQRAGIAAPASAPTLADGGAGALSAATYRGVYTNYNIETAIESNPSPEGSLALGASKMIDWSAVAISTNPFVNARRIYRSIPDQVGVYFFVDSILNNIATTYIGDNVGVADLGRTVSFENGLPPSDLQVGVVWNERLFASDGLDLFFSSLLMVEAFGDENRIPVYPNDGHQLRALHPFGDRLIIGKTNKVHYLVGTGSSTSAFGLYVLEDKHGCMSHHSMQSAENQLFWYGSGKSVFWSDGSSVKDISTPRISSILAEIPDELEEYVVAATFPKLNWYVMSVPQTGYTTNRKVLVYDYKKSSWTVFDHPSDAPQFITDFFNSNYGHLLYSTLYDGHIYHYNDDTYPTDFGTQIEASFTTKADDFNLPGYRKYMDELWLLAPRVQGTHTLKLEVLQDEGEISATRNVSLDVPDADWKAYKLPTMGRPGTKLQTRVTYTGNDRIDVDQLHFEVGTTQRRPGQPR